METFPWDSTFETGLETVDQQHHGLVDLINRFSTSVEDQAEIDRGELECLYEALKDYAQNHFAGEQFLMQKAGVDPRHIRQHQAQHASFLVDVARIRQEAGDRFSAGARPLLNFLTQWLAYHILSTDQAMARQIAAIRDGTDPATAYLATQDRKDPSSSPLLGALTHLFELVSERNHQLFEVNRTLEAKVVERTEALKEANEELRETVKQLKEQQEQALTLSQELASANVKLEALAMTDLLTGLYNRRYAMERLESELSASRRYGDPLSIALLDADGFKTVNDTFGHDAGDEVIRTLGASLKQLFRASDVVCRIGGDEFLVICPRLEADGAVQVAERARQAIASLRIAAGTGTWAGSLSVGVACTGPDTKELGSLMKAADLAVYEAKRMGRNRVEVFRGPRPAPGL